MARPLAPRVKRLVLAVLSWTVAASLAQEVLGAEMAGWERGLEERIELQLKGGAAPVPAHPQPERSHEDSIEPWELVSV